jgi:hypothetical protein
MNHTATDEPPEGPPLGLSLHDQLGSADPGANEPRVTGAPEAIWLVYGDLEHDDTHANCADAGEVTWCEDAQFAADVRYTRTDLVAERVRAAVAAERQRCAMLRTVAAQVLRDMQAQGVLLEWQTLLDEALRA